MLAINGVGFDWSDMAKEQVQSNMALMAFSDLEVYIDKTCSKTCLNNYETLKKQYADLLAKQLQTKIESTTYKRGLDTVEAQLVTYRKNEVLFSEEVVVLKREVGIKQYEINTLKTEFEKLKQEKDAFDFKIEKFDKASKDLDQLLESQITDKSKKGLGYSAVPPPHPLIYNRPNKLDLSYSGLDEFKEPEFKGYGHDNSKKESNVVKELDNSKENSDKSLVKEQDSQVKSSFVEGCGSNNSKRVSEGEPKKVRENNDAPIIEDWVSDDEEQDESMTKPVKKTVIPTAAKIEKPVRKSLRHFNHKVNTVRPRIVNTAKSYKTPINTVRPRVVNTARQNRTSVNAARGKPQHDDKGFVDSGCSRHMTGNIAYLSDFKQFNEGYVVFEGGAYGGKISSKGTLKNPNLDFEDVYFVNELKFNLFSVLQMCDKKNYVLFTDTECLVLSLNFKLPDENQILLKFPTKDNMYSFDMKNIIPKESLTCLVAKATLDESMLWHRRLGHINFKNINKLVKDNLVRGLPTKHFENDQTCVACLKGKQHRASSRTPQQNGVAERRNRTLIEAARTMLADSKLPTTFWAEAVSTTCYIQNRVLVVKPYNKTPYEFFRGFKPALSFMRLFGCHVTILNTLDSLGKFNGKSDECFFVGYSLSSKAFRVYNTRTKRIEENLHIGFLENKPMIEGTSPKWLFDIDTLTQSMNYVPVSAGTVLNISADGLNNENAEQERFSDDSSSKDVNAVGQQVNTASPDLNTGSLKLNVVSPSVSTASPNEEDNTEEEPEVDLGNITNSYIVLTTPNTRIHKDRPIDNVIGEEELLQFKLQQFWILVDLLNGKKAIGTKWVFRNKKDERGIVIRNKARLVAQGHRQEEGLKTAGYKVSTADSRLLLVKKLIQVVKIYTDLNVTDLLTKGFDAGRFQYLVSSISKEVGTPRYLSLVVPLTKVSDEVVHKELGDKMERVATTASSLESEQDSGSGPRCQDTILGDVNAQTRFEITFKQSIDPPLSRGYTHGSGEDSMKLIGIDEIWYTTVILKQKECLVNPVIYTSCIEQFWATAKSSIRRDLHLDDAEDTNCLPTATIFEELARIGYEKPSQKLTFYKAFFSPQWKYYIHTITQCLSAKSTAWNEFSSSKASLIICLATNQKFNLSKYIFDAMVKHLDGGVKFLLAGKDFSGRITPLFDTMMVQPVEEMGEDSDHLTNSTPIHIIDQPSSFSQPKKDKSSKKAQRQEAEVPQDEAEHEESVPTPSNDPQHSAKEIDALKKRIQRLERRKMSRPTGLKRLSKVGMSRRVESSEDQESLGVPEDASKQGRSIEYIDADVDVSLVDETQERQDDDLIFDSKVLEVDVMHVEAKVDGKDDQSKKFDDSTASIDDSTASEAVTTASINDSVVPTTNEEITLAQTLIQIKAAKPKVVTTAATIITTTRPKDRGVVIQEPSEFRVPQEIKPSSSKDKGKGIMIEPEVPLKRKDQIALDEQIARDIQAKLDAELLEEQNLARKQEEEANIVLIESWENTQAMMEVDRLLAERLQSKEREELTDEEKAKLFMELMEKRRKHFAALRAQEKRNRPPTKAQKRTQMSTYLKHVGGYTYKQLKGKSFDEIQKLFDKEMKRVNTFVAMGSEIQESKEKKEEGREETAKGSRKKMLGRKRAGKEQQKESSKKQKVEEEQESEEVDEDNEVELKKLLVIKKDEDIAIDAIPLATKLPVIIDYKLHKEGMLVHYQLIRADGSSKRYSSMIRMLQGIDREDLEALWRIVKAKYGDTRPENEFERVLYGDLKVMFEPDIKSDIWRMLQGYRVTIWKLIDSSGVHFVLGTCGELDAFVSIPDEGDMPFLHKKGKSGAAVGKLVLLQCGFILSPRIVPSFGTYLWNMMDKRLITLLVTSSDFEESCRQVLGTCGELDAFVSIPDEGDMPFLHKKGKSGAAVGKLVLLQVSITTIDELTLAQTVIEIKAAKPKAVTSAATTTTTTRPKARGVVVQELKEERLARQKEEEANIALIESWDNTQAMMEET
ncbi:putative ribonuclease H-like domain-containing protein [Tanacetum coccineum]|uniref:Ribonuclease H-like domain-containing protein n=1 Tax=Tanacetum coccineum TaxID=301880 RepID=A0ABQ5A1X5_9ASTR